MKPTTYLSLVAAALFSFACSENSEDQVKPAEAPPAEIPALQESPSEETETLAQGWGYESYEDEMGTGVTHIARLESANTITFDFPYAGPQHATLKIRRHPRHGKDVILNIERGQFLCHNPFETCTVLVRFDDNKPSTFSFATAADNSTETIFIENYSRFMSGMMKAKRVKIAATFFQEGSRILEFNVSDFDKDRFLAKPQPE